MTVAVVSPSKGSGKCGFCQTNAHERCAVGVKNALPREQYPNGSIYLCLCEEGECTTGRRRCTHCNNRVTDEVNPETWECFDRDACRSLVEVRREAHPLTQKLREAKENAAMAKIQDNKDKAEKKAAEPKEPTFCLVTGEPTKGGLFKPGMDARYVSIRVAEVAEANFTKKAEDAARAQMKKDGVSDALVDKFGKSLGLAKDKAEKKAAAEKAKAEAKAAKAS
jgi:hypothetical protein